MNERTLQEVRERLAEVNKVILDLDPTIRASAFELLKEFVTKADPSKGPEHRTTVPGNGEALDLAVLLKRHGTEKPSDNLNLLAADWYRRYGLTPFSLEHMQQAGGEAGLTLPERPSANFRDARDGGKKLYQPLGGGKYKVSVAGELYFKTKYHVAKGVEVPPQKAKP